MEQKLRNSIIVAHPMQQHSYRLAEALNEKDILHSYITTVYYNSDKLIYKVLEKLLSNTNKKRMKSRQNKNINPKVITFNGFLVLFYLLILRIDKKYYFSPHYARLIRRIFGRRVAKYAIKNKVRAVVIYDKWGSYCAEYLKTHSNIITIMDMSSITAESIVKIASEDIENNNYENNNPYSIVLRPYKDTFLKEYKKEIEFCDYFLAPSEFSKKSILGIVEKPNSVYVCPYGVDVSRFELKEEFYEPNNKIRFLYIGRLSAPKGIFYLLEAFKRLNNPNIELICVGEKIGSEDLFAQYDEYYTYLGSVLNSEISKVYQSCDVYIMPSLWEGMSLTLGEAMASGLPVIATKSSGADSLIDEGKNGFLIESMDVDQLINQIEWFINYPQKIKPMGLEAAQTIENRTWNEYSIQVVNIIRNILINHI